MKYITKSRFIHLLIIFLAVFASFSCKNPEKTEPPKETAAAPTPGPEVSPAPEAEKEENTAPKLVVGIVVDQMRFDFLYRYWDEYGDDGFKRLVNNGYNFKNAKYNYVPTETCPGHTSIYTGTTPSVHGIIANNWFDRQSGSDGEEIYCASDSSVYLVGGGGDKENEAGRMSPRRILTTTVTDELRLATNMNSIVIGISLKDRGAIMPAGHLGSAAYWLDDATGQWITSSYYYRDGSIKPELPEWVIDFNNEYSAEKYLNKPGIDGVWNTLKDVSAYNESMGDENEYEKSIRGKEDAGQYRKPVLPYNFKEVMEQNEKEFEGQYGKLIKVTPFGNSITKDFAIAALKSEELRLGEDNVTDFLAVSFSSTDVVGHAYGPRSVEIEDTYLRLDQDIVGLLAALDDEVGEDNYLVFLTADHGVIDVPLYLQNIGVPAGYLANRYKVMKDLNQHLNRVFPTGGKNLVLDYSNEQVYLNRELITGGPKFKLEAVEREVVNYMMTIDGVADVLTASDLNSAEFDEGRRHHVQNGFNRVRSGDVAAILDPAWIELSEKYGKRGTVHGAPYNYDTHVPLIFCGWNIEHGASVRPVDITDIAPTISALLGIPFPNGATGNPLPELFE